MSEMIEKPEDDWRDGQRVVITAGPFVDLKGVITWIDRAQGTVRVKIEVFGRTTPVEVPFSEIKPDA